MLFSSVYNDFALVGREAFSLTPQNEALMYQCFTSCIVLYMYKDVLCISKVTNNYMNTHLYLESFNKYLIIENAKTQ